MDDVINVSGHRLSTMEVESALVAHPAGILQGVDHEFTGRVERVDVALLRALLDSDIIPVIPPLGCDGEGNT